MPKKVQSVAIGVLSTHERQGWHHPSITDFLYGTRFEKRFKVGYGSLKGFQPAAFARNYFCNEMQNKGFDWIAMIDNDMELPAELLDCIVDAPPDAEVIVPQFFMWDGVLNAPKLCWGFPLGSKDTEGEWTSVGGDKYYRLRTFGTGVIFLRPRVLSKIERPWFSYTYDEMGRQVGSEDIQFALKMEQAGLKAYGYGDVFVGHLHTLDISRVAQLAYEKSVDREEKVNQDVSQEQSGVPADALVAEVSPT